MVRVQGVLGDQLLARIRNSKSDVLLAAPYIKTSVITSLLKSISSSVKGLVVTRWRPEEVAAGVSDLEVFDEIRTREGWALLLCPDLHAKYYRIDANVLLGSANLTQTALAWRCPSNLELLVEMPACTKGLPQFEQELELSSVYATREIQAAVREAARQLELPLWVNKPTSPIIEDDKRNTTYVFAEWLPHARNPDDFLFGCCAGLSTLSAASAAQVYSDMEFLDIPFGIKRDAVRALVCAYLLQHPLVAKITHLCVEAQRFGTVRNAVASWIEARGIQRNPDEAWQALMRWLLFFFPNRYRVSRPRYTELFQTIDTSRASH